MDKFEISLRDCYGTEIFLRDILKEGILFYFYDNNELEKNNEISKFCDEFLQKNIVIAGICVDKDIIPQECNQILLHDKDGVLFEILKDRNSFILLDRNENIKKFSTLTKARSSLC